MQMLIESGMFLTKYFDNLELNIISMSESKNLSLFKVVFH